MAQPESKRGGGGVRGGPGPASSLLGATGAGAVKRASFEDVPPHERLTAPAWAKATIAPTVTSWQPTGPAEPPRPPPREATGGVGPPSAATRERLARPRKVTRTVPPGPPIEPSKGARGDAGAWGESRVQADTELMAGAPETARAGEPQIPPGMILISEEELAEREAEIEEALRQPYLDAAEKLGLALVQLELRLRDDVVDLAAKIASALVGRAFELDRKLTLDVAQRALKLLGAIERVVVKCSPLDADSLREQLPGLARMEAGRNVEVIVKPSDDIRPGGVLMTFDGGVVDAREEKRLERIVEAVKAAVQDVDQRVAERAELLAKEAGRQASEVAGTPEAEGGKKVGGPTP